MKYLCMCVCVRLFVIWRRRWVNVCQMTKWIFDVVTITVNFFLFFRTIQVYFCDKRQRFVVVIIIFLSFPFPITILKSSNKPLVKENFKSYHFTVTVQYTFTRNLTWHSFEFLAYFTCATTTTITTIIFIDHNCIPLKRFANIKNDRCNSNEKCFWWNKWKSNLIFSWFLFVSLSVCVCASNRTPSADNNHCSTLRKKK